MPPKKSLTSKGEGRQAEERKKCPYCENTYSTSGKLTIHVEKNHKAVLIRCKNGRCAAYFLTEEERNKHNEKVHEKPRERRKYPCIICKKEYGRYWDCLKHVKEKHEKNVFKCSFNRCCSYFLNEKELETHLLVNQHKEDEEAKPHKCDKCDYKTGIKSNLNHHAETMHGKESLECDNCKKKYASKYTLERHMRDAHILTTCGYCKKDVVWMKHHSTKKSCRRFKRVFECSGLLEVHEKDRKDCNPPLHQCTKCLKDFPFKCLLELHMKSKNCKPLNPNTEHEMQEATEEEKSKQDGSTVQPKTQEETSNLIHCAHCPESFPRFNALKRHLFSKHGLIDGRFECEPCQKKFLFLKNLIQHFRVAHMKTD